MRSLNSALRQETAFVFTPQPQRTLTPRWASQNPGSVSGLYNYTLQSVGGAVFLRDCVPEAQPERGIHWQIENSTTGALHLTEFTVHGGAMGPRITVDAAFQLFPALAATGTSDGRLLLAALLSNGYLMYTQLRLAPAADATFAELSADMLRPLDLTQHLASLGTPTSLAASPEAVLVGGSNGSVLCIPLSVLEDGNTSRCFELRDSSWALTKLIPGVLYRPRQPAALACVPVTLAHRQLLLVSYDDSTLRVYNVARRQQVTTLELEAQAASQASAAPGGRQHSSGSRHLVPTYISAESPQYTAAAGTAGANVATAGAGNGSASAVTLVVQFEAADTLSRHTYAYTLSSSSSGRLTLANRTELAVEPGGVVSEARVSGDTVWLLIKSQGRAKVLGYDRSSGAVVSSAVLAEAAGEHLSAASGVAGNGAEVDQELWEWMLQAFPDDLSAEGQVCQQVLVPGQTCRASLRDALSYHGAQFSSSEMEQAPHTVLRSWIQTAVLAVQSRTPSASASECWQSFLTTYRSAWARRHPPLGLVLHSGSPEWLGLARGGAVLCVLRRGTVVEALHGTDAAGPLELPPHLHAVHRCAVDAGALLGPLVQEACLALLVAGVDPRERLVPQLAELWHCGPAAAGGGGAGGATEPGARASSGGAAGAPRAAALTDSAREAQQRWRQRRLQLIIATGQRLGALSDPAGAVEGYLRMLRLLSSQASSELTVAARSRPGGAGIQPPSRAAAAFLVSTCRQVSRAAAAAARDAALLLGLIAQQGALGTAPLTRGSLVRIEGPLQQEACELLRRSALGLWLTGTPSSQDEAADMEPALSALRHLRLGGVSPRCQRDGPATAATAPQQDQQPATSGAGATAGAPFGDTPLAARLLPAFCAAYASGRGGRLDLLDGAEAAGLLFTLYLQYDEQPGASLAARVLQLGYQLFQAGEYGNLAELAALAGSTGSSEAGPQFLRGLGITCALALERQGGQAAMQQQQQQQMAATAAARGGMMAPGASRRAERIAEAAGCFFRAAASLASEAGETLRTILSDLRAELAGGLGHQLPPPTTAATAAAAHGTPLQQQQQQQRREVALLQLQFCEAVMQLFEREQAPEGAVLFAEAALGHLRAAYGASADSIAAGAPAAAAAAAAAAEDMLAGEDKLMYDAATVAAAERAAREGRLWSNVYSYCVEMRQYDRAYTALLANPLPTARLQSLRHLVHVLAQEGQLQTLCTLPFAGVAVLPVPSAPAARRPSAGGFGAQSEAADGSGSTSVSYRTVSLLSEALDLLHRRAHNCDLSESPQPYQVLFDFLVCRGDFKGAARAMAAYAWRLRAEAPSTEAAVKEALRAYDLSISCLSLLEPKDAWLDLTDPWVEKLAPRSRTQQRTAMPSIASAAATVDGGAAADGSLPPARGAGAGSSGRGAAGRGASAAHAADVAPVATLQSLQRERTMLHYCAMVAARVAGLEPMRQWDNEDAILRQLLLLGRYEGALALVAGCYGGQGGDPWVRALEAVISALAAHCTRLQLQDGGVPTGGPALPPTDLFVDDPDGDIAASGMGAASAAAVAATLGGRAGPLWAKLRQLLLQMAEADAAGEQQGGGVRVAWLLRDAAAEAVLRTDPRFNLPLWLLDMFLAEPGTGVAVAPASMGSWACGPASLLSLYLRHDRLAAAVELVSEQVELWGREDVLKRRQHCVAWMPYPQLELLHTKLTIAQQLGQERSGALLEQLNAAVSAHQELVRGDTEGLQAPIRAGGMDGIDGGAVRPPLMLLGPSPLGSPVGTPSPLFGMGLAGGLRLFGS